MATMFRVSRIRRTPVRRGLRPRLGHGPRVERPTRRPPAQRLDAPRRPPGAARHGAGAEAHHHRRPASLQLCAQYVFDHLDPGDIVIFLDRVFICGDEVRV